jgi:hypothetical protein
MRQLDNLYSRQKWPLSQGHRLIREAFRTQPWQQNDSTAKKLRNIESKYKRLGNLYA